MIAAFLQFHHDVNETSYATLYPFAQSFVVLGEDPPEKSVSAQILYIYIYIYIYIHTLVCFSTNAELASIENFHIKD